MCESEKKAHTKNLSDLCNEITFTPLYVIALPVRVVILIGSLTVIRFAEVNILAGQRWHNSQTF